MVVNRECQFLVVSSPALTLLLFAGGWWQECDGGGCPRSGEVDAAGVKQKDTGGTVTGGCSLCTRAVLAQAQSDRWNESSAGGRRNKLT